MIYLLTLLCSMCIQFATVNPYNMAELNINYESYIDTVKGQIRANKGGFWWNSPWSKCVNVPDERWIVIKGYYNSQYQDVVLVLCPREDVQEGSSSITCSGYTINSNDTVDSVTVRFNGYFGFGYATNDSSIQSDMNVYGLSTYNFNESSWSLLYCDTPIYYQDTLVVDSYSPPPVIDLGGHASGWSDLLQEDSNGNIYTVLGHSNGSLNNSNTIDLVDSSSQLTDKLLTVLINLTSGMNDNISFGLGSLISLFQQGLNVVGLDGIATKLDNIFNKVEDGVDTTEDYIAWVSEPFDAGEFDIAVQNSGFGNFSALAHTLQTTIEASRVDSTHCYITLDLSNIRYFSAYGSKTYDLAIYLNGSKPVWQPLLLTFIYATVFWGFFRSIPNIIGGVSPVVSSNGGVKNAQ